MADSFELRVKRLFGSKLFESVPKSSFPSSSWSVAEGEVERREWNRDRGDDDREREDDPCSSAFYDKDGCLFKRNTSKRDKIREFEGDLDDVDDDNEDEDEEREGEGEDDGEREEREIRSSVGLDPTLDNEDEEDEYDKAALCRESAGERVYMRDVNDRSPFLNYHAIVPDFLGEPSDETHNFLRDPNADHFAASVRLKEDKSAAESCPSIPLHRSDEPSRDLAAKMPENDVHLKPILKRKEAQIDPKPKKRVRFDPGYKLDHDEVSEEPGDEVSEEPGYFQMFPQSLETSELSKVHSSVPEEPSVVPDYLRNPSKYIRYTFDSSSECGDDETNRRAFEDFRNLVKRFDPDQLQPEFPVELPKTVTFTPRKRSGDAVPMDDSPVNNKENSQILARSMGIAAGESNENGACEMDEDAAAEAPLAETNMGSRQGRQYRLKSNVG